VERGHSYPEHYLLRVLLRDLSHEQVFRSKILIPFRPIESIPPLK
jgi:hypothetical protein